MTVDLAICAIFKNEANYLYEWLSFHSFVGVKHFYLYNNNSTDSSLNVISSWPLAKEMVTVINWPHVPGQNSAYQDMISNHRGAATWCAFIDCDEFLCPQTDVSISDILATFSPQCTALYVHWLMFGSSGNVARDPRLVTERFTKRSYDSFGPNRIGKTILKLSHATEAGFCHIIRSNGIMLNDSGSVIDQAGNGIHSDSSHKFIALNHYYTKSLEEWTTRRALGKADKTPDATDFKRDEDDFNQHDQNVFDDIKASEIMKRAKIIYYQSTSDRTVAI
jgi:hypothetical protein